MDPDYTFKRLQLWLSRPGEGFARVTFTNKSHLNLQSRLREDCIEKKIVWHDLDLSRWRDSENVFQALADHLATLKPGVVSIEGFELVFFGGSSTPEMVTQVNLLRDVLYQTGLRQIWWVEPDVDTALIQMAPDLDSWFQVRFSLVEPLGPSSVQSGDVSTDFKEPRLCFFLNTWGLHRRSVAVPAFKVIEHHYTDKMFFNKETRILFILAPSGTGKTTLLSKLSFFPAESKVFKSFKHHRIKIAQNSIDLIHDIHDKPRSILILDALDEDPLSVDRLEPRILEILEASKSFYLVVITCDTHYFMINTTYTTSGSWVHLIGNFQSDFCCIFPTSFTERPYMSFRNDIREISTWLPALTSFKNLPLRNSLLNDLDEVDFSPDEPRKFYQKWVTVWLKRHVFMGHERFLLKSLTELSEIAFEMWREMNLWIEPEKLTRLFGIVHLDLGERSLFVRNADGMYGFRHISFLEYFVAEHVLATGEAPNHYTSMLLAFLSRQEDVQGQTVIFRFIPKGQFMMGSPDSELHHTEDEKLHHVTISKPFWIAVDACPRPLWRRVMDQDGDHDEKLPAVEISWHDVQTFFGRLAEQGLTGYRLPTEAEWEYTCRAGTSTPYHFGDNPEDRACFNQSGPNMVNDYYPNPWGLRQMHGNVWEWCQDWYGPYDGDAVDPTGPAEGTMKVVRGGSWYDPKEKLRSAKRHAHRPDLRLENVGFRLAMDHQSS